MKIAALLGSSSVIVAVLAACGNGGYSTPAGGVAPAATGDGTSTTGTTSGPTFYKDIDPILETHCQGCHVPGGIAPMPLITYADAQPFAALMMSYTGQKLMPPWGAVTTSDCAQTRGWENDPTLTDDQISTIAAWVNAGAPEGDPSDAPAGGAPAPIDLQNPTQVLQPDAPFTLAQSTDEFRCFLLDPGITSTQYMNGAYIVPGNSTIVHHVIVYEAPDGMAATKAALIKAGTTPDASNSYDCFGGPGIDNPKLLMPWAPGGLPINYPSNAGTEIAAGTALIMQVHYHPHTNANPAPDQTTFKMRTTSAAPEYIIDPELIGNFTNAVAAGTGLLPDPDDRSATSPEFRIPAFATNHTETMQFTLPAAAVQGVKPYIFSVGSHEHLVGTAQEITLKRVAPTATQPANECLLAVPQWNFNWQRGYIYNTADNTSAITNIDELPAFSANDVLQIKCTYNNTMQNAALATSLLGAGANAPSDVYLGETTVDEMCLGFFGFIYKAP